MFPLVHSLSCVKRTCSVGLVLWHLSTRWLSFYTRSSRFRGISLVHSAARSQNKVFLCLCKRSIHGRCDNSVFVAEQSRRPGTQPLHKEQKEAGSCWKEQPSQNDSQINMELTKLIPPNKSMIFSQQNCWLSGRIYESVCSEFEL